VFAEGLHEVGQLLALRANRLALGQCGLVLGLGAEQLLANRTCRRPLLAARALHCVDHDPDQDVDEQEPRDQHEADEVDPYRAALRR
jgi:hypothetical protein